ncbi:unnamed protein product, partial [Discosporangium mesarthrocarpum]
MAPGPTHQRGGRPQRGGRRPSNVGHRAVSVSSGRSLVWRPSDSSPTASAPILAPTMTSSETSMRKAMEEIRAASVQSSEEIDSHLQAAYEHLALAVAAEDKVRATVAHYQEQSERLDRTLKELRAEMDELSRAQLKTGQRTEEGNGPRAELGKGNNTAGTNAEESTAAEDDPPPPSEGVSGVSDEVTPASKPMEESGGLGNSSPSPRAGFAGEESASRFGGESQEQGEHKGSSAPVPSAGRNENRAVRQGVAQGRVGAVEGHPVPSGQEGKAAGSCEEGVDACGPKEAADSNSSISKGSGVLATEGGKATKAGEQGSRAARGGRGSGR